MDRVPQLWRTSEAMFVPVLFLPHTNKTLASKRTPFSIMRPLRFTWVRWCVMLAYSGPLAFSKYRTRPLFLPVMVSNVVSEFLNHPCTLICPSRGRHSLICAFCWPACSSVRGRWLPPSSFLKHVSLERLMGNSSTWAAAVLER